MLEAVREGHTEKLHLTELAAVKFIERHGHAALSILKERAEMAEDLGHRLAARTWREMGTAVARRLGVQAHETLSFVELLARMQRPLHHPWRRINH